MSAITLSTIHAWTRIGGVDVISVDVLLWAFFLLALKDPWRDFRYVEFTNEQRPGRSSRRTAGSTSDQTRNEANSPLDERTVLIDHQREDHGGTNKVQEQSYPLQLSERLSWTLKLLVSIRLNNWKVNHPSHDKGQPPLPAFPNRASFVTQTIISSIRGYLILDLTRAYISYDPYFVDSSISITSPLPFTHLRLVPAQLLRSMIVGGQAWALVGQLFYLPCLLPVGINALGLLPGEWSPHNWSPYFGSLKAIVLNGLRGFWGKYWHQTMRYTVSSPGYAIADALRLRQSSLLRYVIITAIAFGLSGVTHMGLVPPEPLHATTSANSIRLCIAGFFWAQSVALLLEVLVSRLAAHLCTPETWQGGAGLRLRMVINALWVIAWFTVCLPLLGEAGRQLGYWGVWPVPVSVYKGMRGEGWLAWQFLR